MWYYKDTITGLQLEPAKGHQGDLMSRIPDGEIERLKKEVLIERLVMGFGVELKCHGVKQSGKRKDRAD